MSPIYHKRGKTQLCNPWAGKGKLQMSLLCFVQMRGPWLGELQQKVEETEVLKMELQMLETERVRLSLVEEKLLDVLQLLQQLRDLVRWEGSPGTEHWDLSPFQTKNMLSPSMRYKSLYSRTGFYICLPWCLQKAFNPFDWLSKGLEISLELHLQAHDPLNQN